MAHANTQWKALGVEIMNLQLPNRRRFLSGVAASVLVAPAIVHAASLMPVSSPIVEVMHFYGGMYVEPGMRGRWYAKAHNGFFPFDLLRLFDDSRLVATGPVTSRIRVVDFVSSRYATGGERSP